MRNIEFWVIFVIENSIKLQKWFGKERFFGVTQYTPAPMLQSYTSDDDDEKDVVSNLDNNK